MQCETLAAATISCQHLCLQLAWLLLWFIVKCKCFLHIITTLQFSPPCTHTETFYWPYIPKKNLSLGYQVLCDDMVLLPQNGSAQPGPQSGWFDISEKNVLLLIRSSKLQTVFQNNVSAKISQHEQKEFWYLNTYLALPTSFSSLPPTISPCFPLSPPPSQLPIFPSRLLLSSFLLIIPLFHFNFYF